MKKPILKIVVMGLISALLPGAALAHDAIVPCWRGASGSTYQHWNFTTTNNPASPEFSTNAYGAATATIAPGPFSDQYISSWPGSTNSGFWDLGSFGTMTVQVPNRPSAPAASRKYVWVQVAELVSPPLNYATVNIPGATYLGGQRVIVENVILGSINVDQTMWRIEPSAASESIVITAPNNGSLIDEVLVDTLSITNPATYVDDDYTSLADCTLVGWPNSIAPIDKAIGLLAFPTIQAGIDAAPTNGTINVANGTYVAVNVNKPATLSLAPTNGQATVNGNFTLSASSVLTIDVNGSTAGTQYDQWIVNGTVNLNGATLLLRSSTSLATNTSAIIISNDLSDAVSGTFAGLPEGATNTVGGQQFKISYVGGSGNDVTLTMVNHLPIPGAKIAATDQNVPASMYVSKLLEIATDPDGDPITFVGPNPTSTNGGTVVNSVLTGQPAITYTPPSGFTGTDYFTYVITDGKGNSTGTVQVTVNPPTGITFNMLPLVLSNDVPIVTFAGVAGYSYTVQRSVDLTNWVSLTNITLPAPPGGNGIGQYADYAAPTTNAFYRTRYP